MKLYKSILTLLIASTLNANQFSFQFYNDFFAGTDQHFTNGLSLSWLDDTYKHQEDSSISAYSDFVIGSFEIIAPNGLDSLQNYSAGINISQMIITPKDTTIKTPQYNDIPYAGYLALDFYIFEWDKKSFNEYRVSLGVVGPNSGAEQTQNLFHSMIGSSDAEGWDTQLGTKYTLNAFYRYGEISWKLNRVGSLSMDWFNHIGFEAGNFNISTFVGTMFRIGDNYAQNFNVGYPYLKEEAGLLEVTNIQKGFGWSLSTGLNGSIQGCSYIIDKAKDSGYDISERTIKASLYLGVSFFYNVHKLSYFYQSQTPYTNQQTSYDTYGSIVYSYKF